MTDFGLGRRLCAELVGTAILLATVIGSGIMAERLAGGNAALALLGNTIATGAILTVLILVLGPISGAHFNPAVTLSFVVQRRMTWSDGAAFALAQVAGGLAGMMLAHAMFEMPVVMVGANARTGAGQWLGEAVATFGLVATILGCLKVRPEVVAYAVGLFITAGYWFTSSTSFANPAVTIARSFTDSFTGIRPADAPAFIAFELIGALAATGLVAWLHAPRRDAARDEPAAAAPPGD